MTLFYCIVCGRLADREWALRRPPRAREPDVCSSICVEEIRRKGTLLGRDVFGHEYYGYRDYIIYVGYFNKWVFDLEIFDELRKHLLASLVNLNVEKTTEFLSKLLYKWISEGKFKARSVAYLVKRNGIFEERISRARELEKSSCEPIGIIYVQRSGGKWMVKHRCLTSSPP